MACTTCPVVNVSFVGGCSKNIGSCSGQVYLAHLPCFDRLLALFLEVPTTSTLLECIFCKLISLEQSIFLKYLWTDCFEKCKQMLESKEHLI
jgi:hypothetical protein